MPAAKHDTPEANSPIQVSVSCSIRSAEVASAAVRAQPCEVENQIAAAVKESVACHLVADVPVGAFLSAGVDSGALVGLMRDCTGGSIKSVTLRFKEFEGRPDDEAPLAGRVAALYNTQHTERVLAKSELEADLSCILEAMDQPSIDGINTWFAAKAAREQGLKVAISGVGGDELFGSYASFADVPRWVGSFGWLAQIPMLGRATRLVGARSWRALGLHPKAAGMIELSGSHPDAYLLRRGLLMPWEIAEFFPEQLASMIRRTIFRHRARMNAVSSNPQTHFGKVAALEMTFYLRNQLLRDTDWASMAHGLEVRVPLVDHVLLRRILPLLLSSKLHGRKDALARAPSKPLPRSIVERSKTGFSTPMSCWLDTLKRPGLYPHRKDEPQSFAPKSALWARQWAHVVANQNMPANH